MRLVASDLDGTIVGRDGRISARTIRAFHACRDAGVEIVFVTGRPPRWLAPLSEQMGHTGTVICSNGAVVYDLAAEQLLRAEVLPLENVFEAEEIIRTLFPAATFAAETVDGFHLEPGFIEPGSVELLSEVQPGSLRASLPKDAGVVKFLAKEPDISPDDFLAAVGPEVAHLVATTHSAPNVAMLEMAVRGINKAVTLAEYAAALGVDRCDVVAFGDMPNDIQMLDWAGHGYAMASGHPDALAAAGRTAPAFNDDGVAQVLEHLLAQLEKGPLEKGPLDKGASDAGALSSPGLR
jgi:Cof subfamily protein (haloacid dehalogenase superfamily)